MHGSSVILLQNTVTETRQTNGEGSWFTLAISLKFQPGEDKLPGKLLNLPVLVVDDEKVDCQIACEVLERVGMRSEWVISGEETVERIAETQGTPDEYYAIFLDWKMPGMDGIKTTKKIREKVGQDIPIIILIAYDWCDIEEQGREDLRKIPIIAMTADAFAEDIRKALSAGMCGHIAKPIIMDRVKEVLRAWL